MLRQFSGQASFNVTRQLPQGDSSFNSEQALTTPTTFYWQRIPNLPFVLCYSIAEDDLVEVTYDPVFDGKATVIIQNV